MSTTAESTAALRESWRGLLCSSTQGVFSMMVGSDSPTPLHGSTPVIAHVTGTVGIAAAAITPLPESPRICWGLRLKRPPLNNQTLSVRSATGSPVSSKARSAWKPSACFPYPPSLPANPYELHSRTDYDRLEMPFIYQEEPLWIAIDIRK